MIISSLLNINSQPLFYELKDFISDINIYIKLEGLNIAGSIKLKSAKKMLAAIEEQGKINTQTTIISSSSGNLGIALAILCKERQIPFICVSDPNISPVSELYIKIYGGKVIKVTERDENGGFLASRIRFIDKMLSENLHFVFLDQYENAENINAHYQTTAVEIAEEFPNLDYLFIGAGTTGTLSGCSIYYKKFFPKTKIIAVDTFGSVTFGGASAKRYIPGLGTSMKPKISEQAQFDELLMIKEKDTVAQCRYLLNHYGLFLGGSSGTVIQGLLEYKDKIKPGSKVVVISPDFGDRYISTIYNNEWVKEKYPDYQF